MGSADRAPGSDSRQHLGWLELLQIEHREFNGIERILDQQTEFGIAFHRQATAEEQGVGVFLSPRQQQKIVGTGADRQVSRALVLAGRKTTVAPFKVKSPLG